MKLIDRDRKTLQFGAGMIVYMHKPDDAGYVYMSVRPSDDVCSSHGFWDRGTIADKLCITHGNAAVGSVAFKAVLDIIECETGLRAVNEDQMELPSSVFRAVRLVRCD
jgi:hypothetical protein